MTVPRSPTDPQSGPQSGPQSDLRPVPAGRILRRLAQGGVLLMVAVAVLSAAVVAGGWVSPGALWQGLTGQHDRVVEGIAAAPVLSATLFMGAYCLGVTFSLPGAVWMTLIGGYLFGPLWGGLLVFISATGGAVAVFLLARSAWGGVLLRRMESTPALSGLAAGLRRHAFSTLLAARLVPVLPFWVVNLLPALIGVRLSVFIGATMVGIMPGTYIYVSLGAGLATLADEPVPGVGLLTRPEILLPLLGLAVLALLPVGWRMWRGSKDDGAAP
ncbi:TVP38/TMEM64 family protein [Novispirillum itersonii]|uniref:TVP38/TMEM64 family membrane protein n=1 Tax=Novispirillum itersonii TaxID=189 RepID=A0A7W9ZHU7_NOVIT|nr:VTT domain-containing protein [Novispirillum itersonii]MBB6211475.1 putative membrane protein YdjX (TVP38/TMEM64 family) [Novispirillum itersonii]